MATRRLGLDGTFVAIKTTEATPLHHPQAAIIYVFSFDEESRAPSKQDRRQILSKIPSAAECTTTRNTDRKFTQLRP